jgi:hypothetical protein
MQGFRLQFGIQPQAIGISKQAIHFCLSHLSIAPDEGARRKFVDGQA